MIAEVAAAIGIGNACFIDGSASDWGGANSCVAISVAAIIIYRANLSNFRACISNGAKELNYG